MNKQTIIQHFIDGAYPQIFCEKCENTFLTNVYDFDETHVLLEKRSYGLEYFCVAIHEKGLSKVPNIKRLGAITEDDEPAERPSNEVIYSGEEAELRFLYIMEKMKHLEELDIDYFNRCVKDLEWENPAHREKIYAGVTKRYNAELAADIRQLFAHYSDHEGILAWDLHGDNLMQRMDGEIVILDPYTRKV